MKDVENVKDWKFSILKREPFRFSPPPPLHNGLISAREEVSEGGESHKNVLQDKNDNEGMQAFCSMTF